MAVNSCTAELIIPVPWGQITAKTWNDPCGPPVLMVHGLQDNAGSFDRLVPLLPKTMYYVCIDLPGHGMSSRYPKGITLEYMVFVNSVHRVIKHLNWKQFSYIGHSFGGRIGVFLSALYPDAVTKLIVLDATAPNLVDKTQFLDKYKFQTEVLLDLESKLSDKLPPSYTYKEALDRLVNNRSFPIKREAAERILLRALKQNERGYYFATDQRLKFTIINPIDEQMYLLILSQIKCQFLLLMTNRTLSGVTKDLLRHAMPSHNEVFTRKDVDFAAISLLKEKKNFKLTMIEGYHDVHNNEPEVVAPHIIEWLSAPTILRSSL